MIMYQAISHWRGLAVWGLGWYCSKIGGRDSASAPGKWLPRHDTWGGERGQFDFFYERLPLSSALPSSHLQATASSWPLTSCSLLIIVIFHIMQMSWKLPQLGPLVKLFQHDVEPENWENFFLTTKHSHNYGTIAYILIAQIIWLQLGIESLT